MRDLEILDLHQIHSCNIKAPANVVNITWYIMAGVGAPRPGYYIETNHHDERLFVDNGHILAVHEGSFTSPRVAMLDLKKCDYDAYKAFLKAFFSKAKPMKNSAYALANQVDTFDTEEPKQEVKQKTAQETTEAMLLNEVEAFYQYVAKDIKATEMATMKQYFKLQHKARELLKHGHISTNCFEQVFYDLVKTIKMATRQGVGNYYKKDLIIEKLYRYIQRAGRTRSDYHTLLRLFDLQPLTTLRDIRPHKFLGLPINTL